MAWANLREGLYLPFSRNTIVSLLTLTLVANSLCVKSCFARSSFILVFNLNSLSKAHGIMEFSPGDPLF